MTTLPTMTVVCPDGIERRAQITNKVKPGDKTNLSVRVGGRRFAGILTGQGQGEFFPTNGKNGNVFRWLTA